MPPVHTFFVDEDVKQEQKIKIVKLEPGSSALQPIILDRNSDPLKDLLIYNDQNVHSGRSGQWRGKRQSHSPGRKQRLEGPIDVNGRKQGGRLRGGGQSGRNRASWPDTGNDIRGKKNSNPDNASNLACRAQKHGGGELRRRGKRQGGMHLRIHSLRKEILSYIG